MFNNKSVTALIAAAGSGTRMKFYTPKQFLEINNTPILANTLGKFEKNIYVDYILIVTRECDIQNVILLAEKYNITKLKSVIAGGDTRQHSIMNGLDCTESDIVLIHDGARPFVTDSQISEVIKAVSESKAAALGIPVTDTLKKSADGTVISTVDRSNLYSIQTPQGFETELIKTAHKRAFELGLEVTDDCSVAEAMNFPIKIVEGSPTNIKITTPDDLIIANGIIGKTEVKKMRIGMGYDVHRLTPDRKLILGGVEIPYDLGLLGHSDADVLIHAIMDAMLGSVALGDIGKHFPDTDNKWKDANSRMLLREVKHLLDGKRAKVLNIDATIIAQQPKLLNHIPQMIKNIAKDIGLPEDCVSIKATTTEKLGFCGRGEGIAAEAVCCVEC